MTIAGMTTRSLAVAVLALVSLACQSDNAAPKPADAGGMEIIDNPRLLTDFSTPVEEMSLRGVKLGSPRSAIRAGRILSQDDNGWIVCRDGCRYRILADKVVTMGLWNDKALSKLGIDEETDVERVFGKAEEIESVQTQAVQMTLFRYAAGQRRVSWDRMMNKLAAVNIGDATVIPRPSE